MSTSGVSTDRTARSRAPGRAPQQFRTPSGGSSPPPPPPPPGGGPTTSRIPHTGGQLPLPNQEGIIIALAASHPAAPRRLVHRGEAAAGSSWISPWRHSAPPDTRWGYNCKRGNCDDPSIDVVDYFYGSGDPNESSDVYLIDIISAVCPDGDQSPAWIDQTQVTLDEGHHRPLDLPATLGFQTRRPPGGVASSVTARLAAPSSRLARRTPRQETDTDRSSACWAFRAGIPAGRALLRGLL